MRSPKRLVRSGFAGLHGVVLVILLMSIELQTTFALSSATRMQHRVSQAEQRQTVSQPLFASATETEHAAGSYPLPSLEIGKSLRESLAGGHSISYSLILEAGSYAEVVVEQQGIDVVIDLFEPDGKKLAEFDSPNGASGSEVVRFIAMKPGSYRLAVRSPAPDAPSGHYEATVVAIRPATESDKNRVRGDEAYREGDRLANQQTLKTLKQSLEKYHQALEFWRKAGERRLEAFALTQLGLISDYIGEKQKAIDYYNQAIPIRREVGDRAGEAVTLTNLGRVYSSLGEREQALEMFRASLPLARSVNDLDHEAYTKMSMASLYRALGEYDKALDSYQSALTRWRAVGYKQGQAFALSGLGMIYRASGDNSKALEVDDQALSLFRTMHDVYGEASTLANLSGSQIATGKTVQAAKSLDTALNLSRKIGDPGLEAQVHYQLALLARNRNDMEEARKQIEASIAQVESLRTSVASERFRASYLATVHDYYELYVEVLMDLHRARPDGGFDREAFQMSERARARSLVDMLKEAKIDIMSSVDPASWAKEKELRKQLGDLLNDRLKLAASREGGERLHKIEEQTSRVEQAYEQLWTRIRSSNAQVASLTRFEAPQVKEIQQELDNNDVLIEFMLTEGRSFVWALTKDSLTSYEIPGRETVERAAKSVYRSLTSPSGQTKGTSDDRGLVISRATRRPNELNEASIGLSEMLLQPLAARLAGKRLIFVADGALHYVPFAALAEPAAINRPRHKFEPLIAAHEVASLPSASTLILLRHGFEARSRFRREIAVFADPVFGEDDRVKRNSDSASTQTRALSIKMQKSAAEVGMGTVNGAIPRLPGTRREGQKILSYADQHNSLAAFDFKASRELATSTALSQYRYLHFATHGFLNSEHPELSGLVLSMLDSQRRPQNGFLSTADVYRLRLQADLVVLSACQTGLGKSVRGEGLVGLTRGFMYAGAPRVIVSLWSVDDDATAELMGRMYRDILKKRLRPAAALRRAQNWIRERKGLESPFYWAGFVLEGDWQ
jgi:CHAT domain-containing protein/Tfp pilus assembly protein PilF